MRLEQELLTIPLNFFKIDSDFVSLDSEEISKMFFMLEKKIKTNDSYSKCVMIPYACLDFKTNLSENGLYIENQDDDDDDNFLIEAANEYS